MAKKIKFALEMANGEQVRNINALKEHFDIEKAAGYYLSGKLLTWLRDRYYDFEAEQVEQLSKDDKHLNQKLCSIFGIEYDGEELDTEEIAWRTERLNKLKQYTADKEILSKVDQVAFNQEDLSDLIDEKIQEIYLCANRFTIPLSVTNKNYIGIGKAIAVIRSDKVVDFATLKISFVNVTFDDEYTCTLENAMITAQNQQANKMNYNSELISELSFRAKKGYSRAMKELGDIYREQGDEKRALKWYKKAAFSGNKEAKYILQLEFNFK